MTSTTRRTRSARKPAEAPATNVVAFPAERAAAAPRVRWSRVMDAQERIARGWYDRPEVTEQLLDALMVEIERR